MSGNRQLGDFLRTRRHALDPARAGIDNARRRRTPGLRREEVAERAGISSEWYVKLEQGRDVSPSSATVAALARALSLDAAETMHLRRLAEGRTQSFRREKAPAIVAQIVQSLPDPAYVTGARWDVLTWNAAADELFGFERMETADRNILSFMFTDQRAHSLFAEDWAAQAKRMVALFRINHDQYAGDPAFEELLARLTATSAQFKDWWSCHEVGSPSAGTKTLYLNGRGKTRYVFAGFQSNDDPSLKLALYKRCDTES